MNKKLVSLLLVVVLMFSSLVAYAAEQDEVDVTRGALFHLIVEQLQLSVQNPETSLPEDVKEDSPYAQSVRILIERKILNGYPDGTIRGETAVTGEQLVFVLGRILGIPDEKAVDFFKKEYGIALDSHVVSLEEAKTAVKNVLTSDPEAVELVKQSNERQMEVTSFRADVEQMISVEMGESAEEGVVSPVKTSAASMMEYHKEKGIYQTVTMRLPEPLPNGEQEMKMEQYMVPGGMYMKTTNPETGEAKWLHTGDGFPFSFEQMAKMQQSSFQLNDAFVDKNFFYGYEGEEEVNGQLLQKISLNGQLTSLKEILEMMQDILPESQEASQMMGALGETFAGKMSFSGTIWVDKESKLPARTTMNIHMNYAEGADAPLKSMSMTMDAAFYDYDQVVDIVLPEEAKNAEKIPTPFGEVSLPAEGETVE